MELLKKKSCTPYAAGVNILQDIQLQYCELKVVEMEPDAKFSATNADRESCIVVLNGKMTVQTGNEIYTQLGTREDIFSKTPPDSIYISANQVFEVTAETKLKIAICASPATKHYPTKVIKGTTITPEHRGKNANKRTVHTILSDERDEAENLLVVEVFTEGGNWSSYPPHKHDEDNDPFETYLEEIYYHEQLPSQGFVFQRVYTEDRAIDETMTVENEDAVIVPRGYHPVAVPDGYTSYYLNVMAGPIRKWKFHNEAAHEWILHRE